MSTLYNFAQTPANSYSPTAPLFYSDQQVDSYSALKRDLCFSDFEVIILPDNTRAYCLRQSAGVALWWTVNSIADDIITAAISNIRNDPMYPASLRSYVPDVLFHRIGMDRPEVLKTIEVDSYNPLYMLTTIPNIVAFWKRVQQVGLEGLAWIREAKARCRALGSDSGWNWDFFLTQLVDPPVEQAFAGLLPESNALGLYYDYSIPPARANTPSSVSDFVDFDMDTSPLLLPPSNGNDHTPSDSRELVLHPIFSKYALAHPYYDVFSKTPLINNGHVESTQMDTTDDHSSFFSPTTSTSSLASCHSFDIPNNWEHIDYHATLPIVVNNYDGHDVATQETGPMTATDLAQFAFPVFRSDVVNA